jgi:hypothetical protein
MGQKRQKRKVQALKHEKLKRKNLYGEIGVDGRIILNRIINKEVVIMWTEFI